MSTILVTCWNALYFNLFGGSKVTVNQCTASNVTAPEHNNQFGMYKKFIFCKAMVNKNAIIMGGNLEYMHIDLPTLKMPRHHFQSKIPRLLM